MSYKRTQYTYINPFKQTYQKDKHISNFRGGCIFFNRPFCPANSGDPDQMQHYAASHLGLYCLPISSHKRTFSLSVSQSEIQSKKGAHLNTDYMKLYKLHNAWILKRQMVK